MLCLELALLLLGSVTGVSAVIPCTSSVWSRITARVCRCRMTCQITFHGGVPVSVLAGFLGAHPLTSLWLFPEEEWGGWIQCEGSSGILKRKERDSSSPILSSVGNQLGVTSWQGSSWVASPWHVLPIGKFFCSLSCHSPFQHKLLSRHRGSSCFFGEECVAQSMVFRGLPGNIWRGTKRPLGPLSSWKEPTKAERKCVLFLWKLTEALKGKHLIENS